MPGHDQTGTLPGALFDALPIPAIVHDLETIVAANVLAAQLVDADGPKDLIGRPVTDLVHPDGHSAGQERRRLLFERGQEFIGLPFKLRSLSGREIRAIGGGVRFTAGDRHLALALIAPEGARFHIDAQSGSDTPAHTDIRAAALDSVPLPLLAVRERTVVYVNEAACSLLGYAWQDLLGLPALEVLHPEARHAMEERVELLLQVSGRAIPLPLKCLDRDQTCLRLRALAFALDREDGAVFGFTVTETD